MPYKQCIVVREDLEMSRGKLCAQVAHASILAYEKADKKSRKRWMEEGGRKIVLCVRDEKELMELERMAREENLPCELVVDAGLTELPPGTVTALGIGPAEEGLIDKVTGRLKLLR